MKAYVGVTDGAWYRFLAKRPEIDEVNFWRPASNQGFRALEVGEPFFFKSHYPHNRIVGGGIYSGFARLPISEAWTYFAEGNGTTSLERMREAISRYRKAPIHPTEDPVIGCIFVRAVKFFAEDASIDPPPDFASNIVQGKGYDLSNPRYKEYFRDPIRFVDDLSVEVDAATWHRPGPVYGVPKPRTPRLGQQAFKAVVLDAYHQRCAVTKTRIRPVLQAAHIRPLPEGGEHRLDNGMLLRSDIHTLFDNGYLGVDCSSACG